MRKRHLIRRGLVVELVDGHRRDGAESVIARARQQHAQGSRDWILHRRGSLRSVLLRGQVGRWGHGLRRRRCYANGKKQEDGNRFHERPPQSSLSINPPGPGRHSSPMILADDLYENIFAKVSVITAHHPITIANDVPSFTLPVVANPMAVSARVQSRKISSCDAMKYKNALSAGFMKYPGLDAIALCRVNPSALAPASTQTVANKYLSTIGNPA